jgi:hypothetical protein
MFNKEKVVITTSKFLKLRDRLNKEISSHAGYNNSVMRAHGVSEDTLDIYSLQKAFGELWELLHELVVEDDHAEK